MPAAIKTGPTFLDMLGLSKPISEIPDKLDAPTLEPPATIPFTGGATWKGLGAGMLEGAGKFYKDYVNDPTNVETSTFGPSAAIASPLVTLYKDAKGRPDAGLRRYFTELFLKEAKAHGKDSVEGAERLVKRYPRAVTLEELKPELVANKGAYKNTEALVTPEKSDKFGRKPIYLTKKGAQAIKDEGPSKATELFGHETGHVATDALTPGGMMTDYNAAKAIVPYRDIPHEITAFARGNKLRTGDYRAPVNRMGDILGKYGPDAEKTFSDSIDAMNAASLNRYGELRNSPILTSQQRKLSEIRSTPQFTTNRGMYNIRGGDKVRDIPLSWKLDNTVDPEGMTDRFKSMMKFKFGKEYDNTIYSPEGTASTVVAAPFRLPRNKIRPPRFDFNPTFLQD